MALRLAIVPKPCAMTPGEHDDHIISVDRPEVRHDLRIDRLHTLALRSRAGRHDDLPGGIDANHCAFEGADAGAFGVGGKAEAEISSVFAGLLLPLAKRRDSADCGQRFAQAFRIVAAVVDDRIAVSVKQADAIGHLLGAHHVAQANIRRFELELGGDEIDHAFHRKHGLRAAGPAIRRRGCFRRRDHLALDRDMVDLVGPQQMGRGVVGNRTGNVRPRSGIHDEVIAQRENAAAVVEAHLQVVPLIAGMHRAHHVLVAILNPGNGATELVREQRDEQVFGRVVLGPEAAADVRRHAADKSLRHFEELRDLPPQYVDGLGGRPDFELAGAGTRGGHHALAFHRHAGIAMMVKTPAHPMRRLRQCGFDIALADLELAGDVVFVLLMQQHRARFAGLIDINHGRQGF